MPAKIEQYQYLPPGQIVLKRAGETVWRGSLSAPWDDVEYDTAVLCPEDYARLTRLTNEAWARGLKSPASADSKAADRTAMRRTR